VYLALLLAAAAIIAGVVVVAMGRGGELRLVRRDLPDVRFRLRNPEDVAMLRLPLGLLGYQEHATGDALRAIARVLDDKDAEISRLREEVRRLRSEGPAPAPDPPTAQPGEVMSGKNAGVSQPSAQS
jgi:hypothetical protein